MIVRSDTSLITVLEHGLDFITDEGINNLIIERFGNYSYLFRKPELNLDALRTVIDKYRYEANEIYKTTLYDYNPIENYDRTEVGTDVRTDDLTTDITSSGTSSTTSSSTDTPNLQTTNTETPDITKTQNSSHSDAGYSSGSDTTITSSDSTTGRETGTRVNQQTETGNRQISGSGSSTNSSTGKQESTGTVTNQHNLHVHGNIGIKTAMEMIQEQRDIILNTTWWYVEKFADCFKYDIKELLEYDYTEI